MTHPGYSGPPTPGLGDLPAPLNWMQSGGMPYRGNARSMYTPQSRGLVGQEPLPPEAQVIREALDAALSGQGAIGASEAVPWQGQPRRAIVFDQAVSPVGTPGLVIHAGLDATTTTAAAELTTALGAAWVGSDTPTGGSGALDFVPLVTFLTPFGFLTRVAKVGVFVRSLQGWEDLRFRIRLRGLNDAGVPTGDGIVLMPDTFFKYRGEPDAQADFFAVVKQNQIISLEVRTTTVSTPYAVEARVSGWSWPVERQTDADKDTVLRPSRRIE